jgi:hypothetical protein
MEPHNQTTATSDADENKPHEDQVEKRGHYQ